MSTQPLETPTQGVRPIEEVAAELGLQPTEFELYGSQVAKVKTAALERLGEQPQGRYVLVTATTPTPRGEGKTVVSVGLTDALRRLGKRAAATLREPSMGSFFGFEGGDTGGGRAALVPAERINLHLTGDIHAVTSAHNLLMALVENHLHRGNALRMVRPEVLWRRVLDVDDRSLRHVITGLGGRANGLPRETGFDLTACSEVMGILTLATGMEDLRSRLARICVAVNEDDEFVRAADLKAVGAMALTLKEAIRPNLVQTLEGSPCLMHAGPFGNLCVGSSSVLADRLALGAADYVITEVGFGSDCGAEKLVHIKCAQSGLRPCLAVLVTTVRSLKHHSGVPDDKLGQENCSAVHAGCGNLAHHIGVLRHFDLPVVVALNRFSTDSAAECELVLGEALKEGAAAAVTVDVFEQGSEGGMELARAVLEYAGPTPELYPCYAPDDPIPDKIASVARKVYGAGEILMSERAERMVSLLKKNGLEHLPVCMAKTPLSLSHDPYCSGTPRGFSLPVSDLRPAAGAGYVTALVGSVDTMPELPEEPVAVRLNDQ